MQEILIQYSTYYVPSVQFKGAGLPDLASFAWPVSPSPPRRRPTPHTHNVSHSEGRAGGQHGQSERRGGLQHLRRCPQRPRQRRSLLRAGRPRQRQGHAVPTGGERVRVRPHARICCGGRFFRSNFGGSFGRSFRSNTGDYFQQRAFCPILRLNPCPEMPPLVPTTGLLAAQAGAPVERAAAARCGGGRGRARCRDQRRAGGEPPPPQPDSAQHQLTQYI